MGVDQHDEFVVGGGSCPSRDHAPDHDRGAPGPYRDGVDDELHATARSSDAVKVTEGLSDGYGMDGHGRRAAIACAIVCALLGVFAAQALGVPALDSGGRASTPHRTIHRTVPRRRQKQRCRPHTRCLSRTTRATVAKAPARPVTLPSVSPAATPSPGPIPSASPTPTPSATPTPSQVTTSSTPTGCGGEVLPPKPDGGLWVCAFDDEFDSSTGDATALDRSWWTPQVTATSGYTTGPSGSQVCYVGSPNNISVSGGALNLTVRLQDAPFDCGGLTTQYTGGMVSTAYSFSQTYGRFEVRALLPQTAVPGLQETLWLWPVNDTLYGSWPASGEVDFSEFYSEYSTLDVPYIHYDFDPATVNPATSTNTNTNYCVISLSQYNDYAVTWSPGSFTVTINGTTCLVDNYLADGGLTAPAPFDQPFFVILTQALGIGTNAFDPATTPLPATTSIDYVRVWK
jgi:beta-glucanase (GH16 family)